MTKGRNTSLIGQLPQFFFIFNSAPLAKVRLLCYLVTVAVSVSGVLPHYFPMLFNFYCFLSLSRVFFSDLLVYCIFCWSFPIGKRTLTTVDLVKFPTHFFLPPPSLNPSPTLQQTYNSITMAPPVFSDISKNQNGLLNKDFFHATPAAVDVTTTAPNGVQFAVKGKTTKDNTIAGNLEAKFSDKPTGLTLTQGWNTANALDTKVEVVDALTPGLKAELLTSIVPNGTRGAKLNLYFNQPSVTARAFFDLLKGPTFVGDASVGHDGFTAGAEVGYDISSAKVTRYSAAVGYAQPVYNVSVSATNSLSVFSAAYYHKVSPLVEAGAKATWDSKADAAAGKAVGIEFATKYILDSTAFVKAKVADSGLTALSYQQVLRPGVKLGLGVSFDALKLAEPVHKLGWSLSVSA